MSALSGRVSHVLVVFDGTESSRRALLDGRAIADEHAAELSVVTLVAHERRARGCSMSAAHWNRVMDELAGRQLAEARVILARDEPSVSFAIVSGGGADGVRRAVELLGCDMVLLPGRGPLHRRLTRRVRCSVGPGVVDVRA